MASITKHGTGWRAQVYRAGTRKSKTFQTKRAAQDWATRTEYELDNREEVAAKKNVGDLLERYALEVSPGKRGERWEVIRLRKLKGYPLARVRLGDLSARDIAEFRDLRMTEVSAGSVLREMNLLGSVFTIARKEWKMLGRSPMEDVSKPARPKPRTRLPTDAEFERLEHVAGADLSNATARAFHAFKFGCETAMRAGEIVGLTLENVDLTRRVCHLPMTKNGSARDVPLSRAAVALLEALPPHDPVFNLTTRQIDVLWRKVRDKAAIDGLTFHDSRAYALTKLSRKVDVMDLAKISGHRDLSILLNTYYREGAESIARRLD